MENLSFNKDKYVFASLPSMLLIGDSAENNRNKQIALFLDELNMYNVLLKDLVNFSINENDRNRALNIAYYITENDDLLEIMIQKKDLPISKLNKLTKIKREYIEKCRDYIIAYYIILTNSNYRLIQDYFRIKLREDNTIMSISNKKQDSYKGVVIEALNKSAYIVTSKGEFIKIKTNSKASVGELCEGKQKKTIRNYRIHISILLFILILIGSGIIIEYRRTQSMVVIQTTSSIKISINKFNKVIYAYSPTDKGKELVASVNMLNKDIDEAIAETFEYALNNQMLELNKEVPTLSKKTLITINGQALEYGLLTKTNKFISENNIPIVINNAGNQQKLPQYSTQDEENKTKK
ncbi:hypothetical protein psyc5s11_03150 [Clostridium gelidum]|uniref:RsgI N-terminal anti-sigma domain-containing protein n=1 Tax=Clostridium gelidum TaxID=704125 RepID=A0ABM7SZA9_9CLOT|nr:anti-sigma factor domain-containing protein [Clostridium gelidum]BCZ44248.1 hypothetical protein psyc5s11_03150 [Clostridium gelidum]